MFMLLINFLGENYVANMCTYNENEVKIYMHHKNLSYFQEVFPKNFHAHCAVFNVLENV